MTDQIASIFRELEQKLKAIDKALEALRAIDGITSPHPTIEKPASTRKGKKRSTAVRKRMRDAQRARWERVRAKADKVPF